MVPEQRRLAILDLVSSSQELTVDQLARHFQVSKETIRRDLAQLDTRGVLRKVHGGAVLTQTASEDAFSKRMTENREQKARIGRVAARLFSKGDTLMVDAGSTTPLFASELARSNGLTVITNSSEVAARLWEGGQRNRVYLLGGEYNGDSSETLGSVTLDQIARFHADHAVLTIGAIDAVGGFMDYNVEEAMIARAMIKQCGMVTVIADHTKFGRRAMAQVCELSDVVRLVTDEPVPAPLGQALVAAGVEVIVA